MDPSFDLAPAAEQLKAVVAGVRDEQLGDPTPCPDYTVGDLLDHVTGLALAFGNAARKLPSLTPEDGGTPPGVPPRPSASRLPRDWRERTARRLDALVAAWREPAAWDGETEAGGVRMPAAEMAVVALDELVLHGWDLARATGQPFRCDDVSAAVVLQFTTATAQPGQEAAREGLFGARVAVPDDASVFERALGLSGRDPRWTPAQHESAQD